MRTSLVQRTGPDSRIPRESRSRLKVGSRLFLFAEQDGLHRASQESCSAISFVQSCNASDFASFRRILKFPATHEKCSWGNLGRAAPSQFFQDFAVRYRTTYHRRLTLARNPLTVGPDLPPFLFPESAPVDQNSPGLLATS